MQAVLQYPEFLAALLMGVFFFLSRMGKENGSSGLASPAAAVLELLPAQYRRRLHRLLIWAGFRTNADSARLASLKVYPAVLSLFAALFLPMWLALFLAVAVFFLPDLFLFSSARTRQARVAQALPQAIDLILLSVDAGLGFDAALARLTSGEGPDDQLASNPLSEELVLLSRDVLLGVNRQNAYAELFNRSGVEELRIFGAALNQSSRMGLSIGDVLRAHADFMRNRLAQKAEEHAAKMPVWMAFPLWFCIMPALMLVLLGPSLILFIGQTHPLPPGLL